MHLKRSAGILLHISSLPGKYGIGEIGDEAMSFADLLAENGISYWQVLPIGPTGYGDSPYASFSSFAGNELLIDTDSLVRENLISRDDLATIKNSEDFIDYGTLIPIKKTLLLKAANNFLKNSTADRLNMFYDFVLKNSTWIEDYALFMTIKNHFDQIAIKNNIFGTTWFNYWPKELACHEKPAIDEFEKNNKKEILQCEVLQFLFYEQWQKLKNHMKSKGVRVIGDIPIFAAADSADVWANQELFLLDNDRKPLEVAGVPPDYFSEDGQLWGNPIYNWDTHIKQNFSWWISRLNAALNFFDVLRIDHFRGFESFWAIPYGKKNAREGIWRKAPGQFLFQEISKISGPDLPIIAEDLGFITPEVRKLRDDFEFPGMKILQFGFDESESGNGINLHNDFLPHNYHNSCVVYTGTHDNDTLLGWLRQASKNELNFLCNYLGYQDSFSNSLDKKLKKKKIKLSTILNKDKSILFEVLRQGLIREALKSSADLAIIPIQDIIGLDSSCRMNIPSTVGKNWRWRLKKDDINDRLVSDFGSMCALYGRNFRK